MGITELLAAVGAVLAGLVLWLVRRGGQKDGALDEAARKAKRDQDQLRHINEAIEQRRQADETARTAIDVRTDPSMLDRQRD